MVEEDILEGILAEGNLVIVAETNYAGGREGLLCRGGGSNAFVLSSWVS